MYVFCSIKAKAMAEAVINELEGSSHPASFSTAPSNTGSGKGKKEFFPTLLNAYWLFI